MKLTPEQREAIEVFMSALPHWRELYVEQLPTSVFKNDSKFFAPTTLKKEFFPREAHWTWNKSNGTIIIDLQQQFRIRLAKYNSRRRKAMQTPQIPSYKIWSYSVTVLATGEEFSFIWCTKGKTRCAREHKEQCQKDITIKNVPKNQNPIDQFAGLNIPEQQINLPVQNTTTDINQTNLDVADFAFLKEFVPPELSNEFGWTDSN